MVTDRKPRNYYELLGANEQCQHWSLSQILLQDQSLSLQIIYFAIGSNILMSPPRSWLLLFQVSNAGHIVAFSIKALHTLFGY